MDRPRVERIPIAPRLRSSRIATACCPLLLLLVTGCPPQEGPAPGEPRHSQQHQQPGTLTARRPVRPPDPASVWPPRAIWVVRQAYRSPQQVADVIEQCSQAGFNTVLFQVRGNGTVSYRSRFEPWTEEYSGVDPGFDPLQVAVYEAHARGMALHAWVNVMPGWRGSGVPRDRRQLYNAHRDWFLRDQGGRLQPLGEFYVSVNPCLPEVRRYLVALFQEIVTRYPVDGLHLDYIRFPLDKAPRGSDYPYDARTLQLYKQATGKRPQDSRSRWTLWRQQQVTQLVREIRRMCQHDRPGLRLTAATVPDIEEGRNYSFQDGPAWLGEGLIDAAFVMNYTGNTSSFRRRQEAWMRAAPSRWVIPGIGAYTHDSDSATLAQLTLVDQWNRGLAFFSSNTIFGSEARSRQRLNVVRPRILDMQRKSGRR